MIVHLLYHVAWFLGLTNASGWPYLLWSGAGADLCRLALVGGAFKIVTQRAEHHKQLMEMHERHHREAQDSARNGRRGGDGPGSRRDDDLLSD